jgi:hypothetical protein
MVEDIVQFLSDHWPFIVFALVASMVAQVFKSAVWTAKRADSKGVKGWFFWWGRKTLPLHPVFAGALFGLIPGLPVSPGVPETMAAHAMYYGAAGLASTWAFDVLKGIAKKRGITIQSPISLPPDDEVDTNPGTPPPTPEE